MTDQEDGPDATAEIAPDEVKLSTWSLERARRKAEQSGHRRRRSSTGPRTGGGQPGPGATAGPDGGQADDPDAPGGVDPAGTTPESKAFLAGVDEFVLDASLPPPGITDLAPGPVRVDPAQRGGLSGAGADPRDPMSLGDAVPELIARRAWQTPTQMAAVQGRWSEIAGEELAEHVHVESFDTGTGDLVLRADSTAWATQLKYLAESLHERIAEVAGEGVVTRLVVRGPDAPSWRAGRLRSQDSRGPRDTYG